MNKMRRQKQESRRAKLHEELHRDTQRLELGSGITAIVPKSKVSLYDSALKRAERNRLTHTNLEPA